MWIIIIFMICRSSIVCAVQCLSVADCLAVRYNQSSKTCEIGNITNPLTTDVTSNLKNFTEVLTLVQGIYIYVYFIKYFWGHNDQMVLFLALEKISVTGPGQIFNASHLCFGFGFGKLP